MASMPVKKTLRQQIISLLSQQEHSPRELSQTVRVSEKEIYAHLPHIARSLAPQNKELVVEPCRCLECDYLFGSRKRFTKPSRCPRCRGERIQDPRFSVKSRSDR
jgi:predicted Zn-ribbon and HTH transcriptional regulator